MTVKKCTASSLPKLPNITEIRNDCIVFYSFYGNCKYKKRFVPFVIFIVICGERAGSNVPGRVIFCYFNCASLVGHLYYSEEHIHWNVRLSPHVRESKTALDSNYWIPDLFQWNLDSGFQLLVGFRIPTDVFRISQALIPRFRIPHANIFRIPLHEATLTCLWITVLLLTCQMPSALIL